MSNVIGELHLWTAVAALLSGGMVVLRPKGTPVHKTVGRIYLASMFVMLVTAFSIYDLFGRFGPFHIAAIVSSISIVAGVLPVWFRRPRKTWVAHHAMWMAWSYIGLCAAGVSEISTRYLALDFGLTVAAASLTVMMIGYAVVRLRMPEILARFGV